MLLDISQPVTPETSHFPGDVPFSCGWTADEPELRVGWVRSSPHVGTHVDAPYHYGLDKRVDQLDLDAFVGPCVVIDATRESELHADLLRNVDLARAPRVLFRTQRTSDPTTFLTKFPILTRDAVAKLAEARVKLVGVDAPSMDNATSKGLETHKALGRAGIANVENLWLDRTEPGLYELLAAPIKWTQLDAAPLRAILRS